jgi:hypothetical protein
VPSAGLVELIVHMRAGCGADVGAGSAARSRSREIFQNAVEKVDSRRWIELILRA